MHGWSVKLGLVAALALGFVAVALSASAGNTLHPRTPVLWPDAPCIQTVDRSVDPLLVFEYAIPAPDTFLSFDEFEDSRTHQFIGFCRQWPAGRPPPRYVSVDDLERALEAGFETTLELDDPEATLETSLVWAGCWTRITADDARRPITDEAAAEPVIWDTSGEPAGTWMIAGYTWEPPLNLWSRSPWVVRVLDDDQQPTQAAVTLADTDDALYADQSLDIELCVDAGLGSTVALEWVASKAEPFEWAPLATAAVTGAGTQALSLTFVPPEPSRGKAVLLRASVEQPLGPAYVAHALASVIVFQGPAPEPSDDDGDGDGDADETGDLDGGTETESAAPPSDAGESDRAGRCSVDPARGNLFTLGLWLGLALLSRRRRAPAHELSQ